ncbi:ProQ/FINO family protein [Burkholderia ubonensis]|uniref:ProQ/FINO family protein n=1 Tax=Burkholderia ubonensis TaxID=101571 RepID=UPI000756984F|nr:ProQ/FINO family protein [Burkholderia ubonensis]KVQ34556.1 ProQ activator of osmoprotectant transporter prop [Burkholderia ubonensis]KVR25293.1 ProQ activator of osmoprotectant transporter prop [Burkholderia ubonensis]KVU66648.1 ProQ activator of osmoprotectant transporter prop [Burkholderia ubonensis]KVV11577.1 ProQ activator of osmoprotectant transporter prop [Burkholderia ubonensis]KVZ33976.1 ProQ activator of osmoprotectant transporter prop [Burkholderia ubonensis]
MGFEQLAALRDQLAAKAKQERNAKRAKAQPDSGTKPSSGGKPASGAKSPSGAKAASGVKASSGAKAFSAARPSSGGKPSAPVDPVVVAIGKLQKRFPLAFPKNPAPKVPLKVGIWADLAGQAQAVGLTEAELRDAMSTWCRGNRYWSCLVEDAVRVDLQGNEAGRVSKDDAARARRLKARGPKRKGAAQAAKADAQPEKAEAQAQQAETAEPQTTDAGTQAAPVEPQAAKTE